MSDQNKEIFDGERFVTAYDDAADDKVFTPDDIMSGRLPDGRTLVVDTDNYYMGSVMAEKLRQAGLETHYVTSADSVASWAENTAESGRIRAHLLKIGVTIETAKSLSGFDGNTAELACEYSGSLSRHEVENVVIVSSRTPNDGLYREILECVGEGELPFSLSRIGDCDAPAIIAAAVYAGHRYAQELDADVDPDMPLKHDRVDVGLS